MKPDEVLVLHTVGAAGPVSLDALQYTTGLNRRVLVIAITGLRRAGYLTSTGRGRLNRYIYRLTEAGERVARGPELMGIAEGRQVFSTLLNARVKFRPVEDDYRNLMARPTYVPPRASAPARSGALDATRLPSKGFL